MKIKKTLYQLQSHKLFLEEIQQKEKVELINKINELENKLYQLEQENTELDIAFGNNNKK
jgi:hypothetical protein